MYPLPACSGIIELIAHYNIAKRGNTAKRWTLFVARFDRVRDVSFESSAVKQNKKTWNQNRLTTNYIFASMSCLYFWSESFSTKEEERILFFSKIGGLFGECVFVAGRLPGGGQTREIFEQIKSIPCRISNALLRLHNVGGFHHEYCYKLVVPLLPLAYLESRVSQSANRAEKGAHVRLPFRPK